MIGTVLKSRRQGSLYSQQRETSSLSEHLADIKKSKVDEANVNEW